MPLEFIKGKFYRQPVFFGPVCGPRQWPVEALGDAYDPFVQTRKTAGVRFLADKAQLEALLPEGFDVWGEPVVTIDITWQTNIPWMAGRGYAFSDVKFPVVYRSRDEGPVHGTLVLIRWENLTDPIISGRDELGHHKLWCKIPDFVTYNGRNKTQLSWLNHIFADFEIWDLQDAEPPKIDPLYKGQLGYKWTPKTGCPGEADDAYAILTPLLSATEEPRRFVRYQEGHGYFDYKDTTWEQFPFAYNIVSGVAALGKLEFRGASVLETCGGAVFPAIDTRILR